MSAYADPRYESEWWIVLAHLQHDSFNLRTDTLEKSAEFIGNDTELMTETVLFILAKMIERGYLSKIDGEVGYALTEMGMQLEPPKD